MISFASWSLEVHCQAHIASEHSTVWHFANMQDTHGGLGPSLASLREPDCVTQDLDTALRCVRTER